LVDEVKELTPIGDLPGEDDYIAGNGGGEQPSPPSSTRRIATWLGYGTLFLVLLLVGAGVFLLQELRSKQEGLGGELSRDDQQMLELTHQITGLQSELSALHNQFATLQAQVTTEDAKFERQIGEQSQALGERLVNIRAELAAEIQHIQRQLNKTRGDVMVADAEYLLSIANQKLHLVGDVKSVLAAMEAADQRLHDSGDPAVFKVREALAAEIGSLKKFDAPDVVGISAKLLAMETRVKDLPLFLPHADKIPAQPAADKTKDVPAESRAGDNDGTLIDSALNNIRDLVTVRRTDRPVQAILLPEQVVALRQVLLLRLETARAALLRGDESLFKAGLESALSWLDEHFDSAAAATGEMRKDLKALETVRIQVDYPDVGKSLALLRNIEKLRVETEERESASKGAPSESGTPNAAMPKAEPGAKP
jgi:uncharacterized protein HemX